MGSFLIYYYAFRKERFVDKISANYLIQMNTSNKKAETSEKNKIKNE